MGAELGGCGPLLGWDPPHKVGFLPLLPTPSVASPLRRPGGGGGCCSVTVPGCLAAGGVLEGSREVKQAAPGGG